MNLYKSLTGKWIGAYTLGSEYESNEGKSFEFTLDLVDENKTFKGVCFEAGLSEYFQESITVIGFWDKEIISFTKKYPSQYFYDEDGKIIVDNKKDHPDIYYSGRYNETDKEFSGDFELVVESNSYGSGWLELCFTGTWMIKRIKES